MVVCAAIVLTWSIIENFCSDDIYGTVEGIPLILDFSVWFGICRYVSAKEVVQKCGQHAPIQVLEVGNRESASNIDDTDRCWNIGQITSVAPSLVNESNPESGITMNYGSTHCCLEDVRSMNVTALLKPDDCQNGPRNGSVTQGNFLSLTNCSDPRETLEIEVKTSILCERNIEWRLSTTTSAVICNKHYTNQIHCVIELSPEDAGRKASLSSQYCQNRFQLWLRFSNGSELNTTVSYMEDLHESCAFHLASQDICSMSVVYSYPSALPELLAINGSSILLLGSCKESDDGRPVWHIVVGTTGAALLVIVVVFFFVVGKFLDRRRRRGYNVLQGASDKPKSDEQVSRENSNIQHSEKVKVDAKSCPVAYHASEATAQAQTDAVPVVSTLNLGRSSGETQQLNNPAVARTATSIARTATSIDGNGIHNYGSASKGESKRPEAARGSPTTQVDISNPFLPDQTSEDKL